MPKGRGRKPKASPPPQVGALLSIPEKGENMETLKNKRSELGLSYRELAQRTGLSAQTLWNIENGVNSPNLNSLRSIARGLGVTVEELIQEPKTH